MWLACNRQCWAIAKVVEDCVENLNPKNMHRFYYQPSVSSGAPAPCTQELFEAMLDDPRVADVCRQIAALDNSAPDYDDRKGALKRQLPIAIFHAGSFSGTRRISAEATPSGLIMIDVDHLDDPRAEWERVKERLTRASESPQSSKEPLLPSTFYLLPEDILFCAITPSGHGLRLVAERQVGESIEDAQLRISGACGFEEIDAVTKDLARASYMMPRSYVLHYEPTYLFSYPDEEAEEYWKNAPRSEGAATPSNASDRESLGEQRTLNHVERSERSSEGKNQEQPYQNSCSSEGASSCLEWQPQSGVEASSLSYRGIEYSSIVDQLLILTGNAGGALKGERNTVYFSLANYMRYVCDFNADLLLSVLPDFGLAVQERRSAIKSALGRPRKTEMPLIVQSAVTLCEQQRAQDELTGNAGRACDLPLPKLPRLLSTVCRRMPEAYRPAMVIAALPVLGTLATRIRFNYLDGQEHSLSFFTCITAPCASGKSFIRRPVDLLLTPINEQDELERQKEQTYMEKLRACKNAKNQPEDPHACPRNNGVNTSVAKLLQLLTYSEGKHLIGICEEIDSLTKSEKAGAWSEKSDIYRLGFDNAPYGQNNYSPNSFSGKVRVYYNLLLTGTPRSMQRFFKDETVENGLMTRTCFAQLPDTSYAPMPHFEPYTDREQQEIVGWARQLDQAEGTIRCWVVEKAIAEWLEEKRQRALDADSHAADIIRRRAAVIGFRAGMLCYLLEGRTMKPSVGKFAAWVAEYVFRNQMELFGERLELELSSNQESGTERGAAQGLIDLLPREFQKKDVIALKAKRGQSVRNGAINMLLHRWQEAGRIRKIGENRYERI